MAFPEPVPGLVIRYSYLWESESRRGQEEGRKDRPCAVVLAVKRSDREPFRVMVAPITHSPPDDPRDAIEIPPVIAKGLGLDHTRSWIVTREVNIFNWPGPDIRSASKDRFAFGRLTHALTEQLRQSIFQKTRRRVQPVNRDA